MRLPTILALALPLLLALDGRKRNQNTEPFPGGPAPLSEIRAGPSRFLGAEVSFTLQFQHTIEDWNPFFSRFGPADWLGFSAWPDERFTWDPDVFDDPASRLFVKRGSAAARLLSQARTHARFEAHGRVRELFLGQPWIEIDELVSLPSEVGEGTILHVGRARELAAEGQWEFALEQYERAKAAPLPLHALGAIEREIAETREAWEGEKQRQGKRVNPR